MRRLPLIVLLALVAWPEAAAAELKVSELRRDHAHGRHRGAGRAEPARVVRPLGTGRAVRALHIRAGARSGPFWQLDAVVADVKRDPVVRFPHSFVFDKPTGAQLFAVERENELSSSEEEASGRMTFGAVRCGRRLAVRFRVDAVLGSEFFGGETVTMRGSFRASK